MAVFPLIDKSATLTWRGIQLNKGSSNQLRVTFEGKKWLTMFKWQKRANLILYGIQFFAKKDLKSMLEFPLLFHYILFPTNCETKG